MQSGAPTVISEFVLVKAKQSVFEIYWYTVNTDGCPPVVSNVLAKFPVNVKV